MARVILDRGAVTRAIARFIDTNCGEPADGSRFCLFRGPGQSPATADEIDTLPATPSGRTYGFPCVKMHRLDFVEDLPVSGGALSHFVLRLEISATAALLRAHGAGGTLIEQTISRLDLALGGVEIADDDTGAGERGDGTHFVELRLKESAADGPEGGGGISGSERLVTGFAIFSGRVTRTENATFEGGT